MATPTQTPNYGVGKAVAVSVGGVLTYNKSGKLDRKSNNLKVTNARSGGFQQMKAGTRAGTLSLDLVYNGDDPPAIYEGQELTVIFDSIGYETAEAIENTGSGGTPTTPFGRLHTGQYLVGQITDSWQSDGDYGWSLSADSTGPYTTVETATGVTPTT